jgi:hypothetical protein
MEGCARLPPDQVSPAVTSRPPFDGDVAPPVRPRVCFLYLAQAHQALHSLSAALELARMRPDIAVEVAATSSEVLTYVRAIALRMGPAPITWRLLGPGWLRAVRVEGTPAKLPMLAANLRTLSTYDVIVAPERTTAALRTMGVKAKLVYTQHGAGDRKGPFEPRLRAFDLVFAAGPKQRDRMLAEGLVTPGQCAIVGYPKFDLVDQLQPVLPRLFANNRPTVLYNPHFLPKLGSWPTWGRQVLQAFTVQRDYNLIFAPHVRLFGGRPVEAVAEFAPFRGQDHIHLDLGETPASIDMSYTRLADIYLGDVSSQIYEFLRQPRPCLFLNPHGAAWEGDESYRHWRYGPVLNKVEGLIDAVTRARFGQNAYRAIQVEGFRQTYDLTATSSSQRAAEAIANLLAPEPLAAIPSPRLRHAAT